MKQITIDCMDKLGSLVTLDKENQTNTRKTQNKNKKLCISVVLSDIHFDAQINIKFMTNLNKKLV